LKSSKHLSILALFIGAAMLVPQAGNAESDERAIEVAKTTMAAMGGQEAFDAVRGVRFDFAFSRDGQQLGLYSHWWDRQTGDYRVTGTDRETSAPFEVRLNVDTKEGSATLDGVELTGEALQEKLEGAYGRYINDTYWFLMPWKWLDPGVNLAYEGEREVDGEAYDVVVLTFENDIGLTSNDRYWGFVSKKTGLIGRWEYVLQDEDGKPGTGEPTVWTWGDWQKTESGILVSKTKTRIAEGPEVTISFPVLSMSHDAPDEISPGD